jgi:Na+-translocating ferredoxin:NAD+ oxidoreductase subunit B
MGTYAIIGILGAIGFISGILIFIVNRVLPDEPDSLKKTEEIVKYLPNMNCGACGYPGCFAYAQALAEDKNIFFTSPCATVLQDPEMLKGLEKVLDIEVDASSMNKKAVVKCYGNSKWIGEYNGIKTCKAANMLSGGPKECPFGCLGFGDCVAVCPTGAIHIDDKMNVAVIDPEKCTGCGLCVDECPRNLIELVPSQNKIIYLCNYQSVKNIPGHKKCDRGCIQCRDCMKACDTEAITWNAETGNPEFDFSKCNLCGKCIEVCPHNCLVEFSDIVLKEKLGPTREEKREEEREKINSLN